MKALCITEPGILEIQTIEEKRLSPFEIRIKVASSCLCGSDIKNINNPVFVPQIPGHEFSGEIIETSLNSKNTLQVGDKVTAFPMIGCLKCHACLNKNFRDCHSKKSYGFDLAGSFAQEIVVDSRFVVKLYDEISLEQGALIEHYACAYRLCQEINSTKIKKEDHIVIVGDGPIALADLQLLRFFGYKNISLLGKHAFKKDIAFKLGARNILDVGSFNTNLQRIDTCIYAVSADETLGDLISHIDSGGIIFPQTRIVNSLVREQIKHKKISYGRAFAYMFDDFEKVMNLFITKKINTDHVVTSTIDLFDLPKLSKTLQNRSNEVKIKLVYSH